MAETTFKENNIAVFQINIETATPVSGTKGSVAGNGAKQLAFNCEMAGWRPLGVVGVNTGNQDLVPMLYRFVDKIYGEYNFHTVYIKVRNVSSNATNFNKGFIDILYAKE